MQLKHDAMEVPVKGRVREALVALLILGLPCPAAAQAFPTKVMRLVVPFSPGGNVDITARAIAPGLSQVLGQQMIVDNRPGALGQIGAEAVARAAPDGHTLMMASSSVMTNGPAVYPKLSYDILKDFAPVGRVSEVPLVLVVHPTIPAKNPRELIALAKSKPGDLLLASGGLGSTSHLVTELFAIMAGVKVTIIPYKGAGPAVTDLLGGHVGGRIDQIPSSIHHIQNGRLRAVGVTTAKRTALLPSVPTFAESGVPGFDASTVTGVLAPAATPPAIIATLNQALIKVLSDASLKERFASLGAEVRPSSPEELGRFIRDDLAKWVKVVKQAGIKPE
jgi:tripartite-type tricarboxylate transporter receptor subunit TctC